MFGAGSHTVTLVIYSNAPSLGGTLLASGTFTSHANVFSGASLNTPLHFALGQSFFVGFENVSGLGANITNAGGAVSLGTLFFDDGGASFNIPETGDLTSQPILEFFGMAGTQFAATPGLTPNQHSVAANIDFNGSPGPALASIITALQNLPSTALPGALDELSPQEFGQFATATAFNNASFATEEKDNYLAGQRTGPNGTFADGNGGIDASGLTINDPSYDPNLAMVHSRLLAWNPAPYGGMASDIAGPILGGVEMKDPKEMKAEGAPVYTNPWNFYVQGNVILAQGYSQPDVSHFDDNTESVTLGTDYRITPNFLIGLAAGYAHTDATLDNEGSSATVDSYSPGFYASYADKGWYANLSGDYIHNAYTQSRVIGFLGQTANSAPEGNEGVADLDGGYDFHQGALTFGPLAGVQYTHLTVDGYTESGSIADLSVADQNADSLRSRLGGRISFEFSHCGIIFTPHLDATWQHEFLDQSRGITSQFNGGLGSFSVETTNPSRDSALVDAGLDAEINQTVTAFADYEVEAGQENYFGQSVQGGVKIGF
jgi:uncharacterized protein YhjY with autotransporter beta-barrel domain